MLEILGGVDRLLSVAAEFTLDRVAPGEGDLKTGQQVGHGVRLGSPTG